MKQIIDITDSILPLLSSFISALFIAAFTSYQIKKWRKRSLKACFLRFRNSLVIWSTQGSFSYAYPFSGIGDSANDSTFLSQLFIVANPLKMADSRPSLKLILCLYLPVRTQALPAFCLINEKVAQATYCNKS